MKNEDCIGKTLVLAWRDIKPLHGDPLRLTVASAAVWENVCTEDSLRKAKAYTRTEMAKTPGRTFFMSLYDNTDPQCLNKARADADAAICVLVKDVKPGDYVYVADATVAEVQSLGSVIIVDFTDKTATPPCPANAPVTVRRTTTTM